MYILLEKQKYFACWLKIPVHSLCSVPSAFAGTTRGGFRRIFEVALRKEGNSNPVKMETEAVIAG
jgi:hypothetical protein